MRFVFPFLLVFCLAFAPVRPVAQTMSPPAYDPASPVRARPHGNVDLQDGAHRLLRERGNDSGLLVPDLDGNYVLIPGGKRPDPDPAFAQAQELKLKMRELVSQLLDTWPNDSLAGIVALPTTFVSLDNFSETSGLGRYMAESLFYEFNTRGFAVREYRADGVIRMEPGRGEFALSRALPDVKAEGGWAAMVVGTYYRDQDALFVNARMIRPADGLVLRTAQLVLPMNGLVRRMSAPPPPPHPLRAGSLRINQGINQGRR
jgi:hypothetical protein